MAGVLEAITAPPGESVKTSDVPPYFKDALEDAERLLHALQEFAERHDEDVIAGKRLPLIGLPPAAKWST